MKRYLVTDRTRPIINPRTEQITPCGDLPNPINTFKKDFSHRAFQIGVAFHRVHMFRSEPKLEAVCIARVMRDTKYRVAPIKNCLIAPDMHCEKIHGRTTD